MKMTCRQLASCLGVDYLQASSIIKLLIKSGLSCKSGKVSAGGRGRPSIAYEIPEKIEIDFLTGIVKED